jgi:3-hydroxyacyl-[acyl-carrier-protein] dehydratase
MATTVLDSAAVERLLAHRFPFLLVDRIEVIEPGRRVRGTKRVTGGEWWADTTERGAVPAMPHTLVLEALAQTSGALLEQLVAGGESALAYFMGLDRVRLRHEPEVGDTITLDVSLRQFRRGICRTLGVATIGDRLVASAELTTVVRVARG